MSDLFSIYEDSLNIVLKNITTVIESMNNLSKEKTESALNDAHNNLKEADRIVKFIIKLCLLVKTDGSRNIKCQEYQLTASANKGTYDVYNFSIKIIRMRLMDLEGDLSNYKTITLIRKAKRHYSLKDLIIPRITERNKDRN